MPVRFTFPLDPLLKARRLAEQELQRALAIIDRERVALEERLRRQQLILAEGKQSLHTRLVGKIDAHALRMHAATSIHSTRIAQRLVLELAGVHKRLDAARTQLVEASRRRRVVELLRERRFEQWKAEIERMEIAALDELAMISGSCRQS